MNDYSQFVMPLFCVGFIILLIVIRGYEHKRDVESQRVVQLEKEKTLVWRKLNEAKEIKEDCFFTYKQKAGRIYFIIEDILDKK